MGMIGKYLDLLNDEQRDRVIEHPDPTYDGRYYREDIEDHPSYGCACLVGTAEVAPPLYERLLPWVQRLSSDARAAAGFFPYLTRRFGAPRVWAAVKARAARGNRIPTAAPARETVGAA